MANPIERFRKIKNNKITRTATWAILPSGLTANPDRFSNISESNWKNNLARVHNITANVETVELVLTGVSHNYRIGLLAYAATKLVSLGLEKAQSIGRGAQNLTQRVGQKLG